MSDQKPLTRVEVQGLIASTKAAAATKYAPWVGMILTVVLASAGALWHASQFATRTWVEGHVDRVVQREAPYVHDRSRILDVVNRYQKERDQLVESVKRIEIQQREINTKLSELVRRARTEARRRGR